MRVILMKLSGFWQYMAKVFEKVKISIGAIISIICYIFFPNRNLLISLGAVLIAASFDVITKFYAIAKQAGGYKNAARSGAIWSKTLWELTERKIISYLIISMMIGLSYRVMIYEAIPQMLGTFVFSMIFIREFQSIIENLIGAGADLQWLLIFAKTKEQEIHIKHNRIQDLDKEEDKDEL